MFGQPRLQFDVEVAYFFGEGQGAVVEFVYYVFVEAREQSAADQLLKWEGTLWGYLPAVTSS